MSLKWLWLESNNGSKWEIIAVHNDKLTIRKYHKGTTVGIIAGITLDDIKKYLKPCKLTKDPPKIS